MKEGLIGLLDCNNFFVSCERLFRPDLMNKPVVVLSSNDGCVVARSQEIKDMGVPMGVPYFKIKDTLQKARAAVFSSHFALYRDISRRVFSIVREEFDVVEQYSVDEAFFSLSGEPEPAASTVRQRIWREVGIPVSVGIARTKTRAKFASRLAKKTTGVCVLDESAWVEHVPTIPLGDVWGIGSRLANRYRKHHLYTVADLLRVDPACLTALFGINGLRLQQELAGTSVLPITMIAPPQKSLMSSRSFAATTMDRAVLADALAYHTRHVAADLRAMDQSTATLRVMIAASRYGDFFLRGGSQEIVISSPTNDTFVLLREASMLLDVLYEPGVPYQKIGVQVSGLGPVGGGEQRLFSESDADHDRQLLWKAVDALNGSAKRDVVVLGSRLRTADWRTKAVALSPAYTTNWSQLASVKAK